MCHNVNSVYAGCLKCNPREKIIQSPRDLDPQVKNHWDRRLTPAGFDLANGLLSLGAQEWKLEKGRKDLQRLGHVLWWWARCVIFIYDGQHVSRS